MMLQHDGIAVACSSLANDGKVFKSLNGLPFCIFSSLLKFVGGFAKNYNLLAQIRNNNFT
jgi:hypothetical protein